MADAPFSFGRLSSPTGGVADSLGDPGDVLAEFTIAQAARLTGCSVSQIRYWVRTGLLAPFEGTAPVEGRSRSERLRFEDLVALRIIRSLLNSGLATNKIRRAVRYLSSAGEDYTRLRIITDGENVWAARDDGEILDALSNGQLVLFVAVDSFARETASEIEIFNSERAAFVAGLRA